MSKLIISHRYRSPCRRPSCGVIPCWPLPELLRDWIRPLLSSGLQQPFHNSVYRLQVRGPPRCCCALPPAYRLLHSTLPSQGALIYSVHDLRQTDESDKGDCSDCKRRRRSGTDPQRHTCRCSQSAHLRWARDVGWTSQNLRPCVDGGLRAKAGGRPRLHAHTTTPTESNERRAACSRVSTPRPSKLRSSSRRW